MDKKNNVWPVKDDPRARETGKLLKVLIFINVLIVLSLALILAFGISSNGVNISVALIQFITFVAKLIVMNFFFILVRWTLVRFRYDQVQDLGWKILLPISIANIFVTAIFVVAFGG